VERDQQMWNGTEHGFSDEFFAHFQLFLINATIDRHGCCTEADKLSAALAKTSIQLQSIARLP
jgi:hypothetical protein